MFAEGARRDEKLQVRKWFLVAETRQSLFIAIIIHSLCAIFIRSSVNPSLEEKNQLKHIY